MSEATIVVAGNGNLRVNGNIDFTNVVKLRALGYDFIAKQDSVIFDLTNITIGDNSILSLLISWLRYAKKLRKSLGFVNLPQQLVDMARLCNLDSILI